MKDVKKFFKDNEASLNAYNQKISGEDNAFTFLALDKDKVDTLFIEISSREECVSDADKFMADSLC